MKDYQQLLAKFPDSFKARNQIMEYLDKYWLDQEELNNIWSKTKSAVFKGNFKNYPSAIFHNDFDIIIRKGGTLLDKEDLESLKVCTSIMNEKHIVVLQDYNINDPPGNLPPSRGLIDWPPLRFKFPADINYAEIKSGDFVSESVFDDPVRDYFMFGDSGNWGRYIGDDFETPLDILGFKKEYSELFHGNFKIPEEDVNDLKEWVAGYGMKLPEFD